MTAPSLSGFLNSRWADGGFSTEDALASLLPLFRQVNPAHRENQVAPLDGTDSLQVDAARVWYPESARQEIRDQLDQVLQILNQHQGSGAIRIDDSDVIDVVQLNTDDSAESYANKAPDRPGFVTGYLCWEHLVGHHDPLTDIFCLGQLLASVALGLDFDSTDDVRRFAKHRRNLFAIQESVHPVIARMIVRMTELDRSLRIPELDSLIEALENYRMQEIELTVDPDEIDGFESRDLSGKQQVLLDRLQTRLFEISRRNRLLNFRSTGQTVDLTLASVPLSFDYQHVRPDQILTCDERITQPVANGERISLNRYMNFSEAVWLPGLLDQIGRQSRRDLAEFGFVQLRLVLCMLNWANLKVDPPERYVSPLVLVPVRLYKQRGVRDTYSIEPVNHEAEINPVVRFLFARWYGIELPEMLDLGTADLKSLFEYMTSAIAASEPAVELELIDRPRIRVLHSRARRQLERYRRRARLSGRGVRTVNGIEYSYDPANYHPLGIRLFSRHVRPPVPPATPDQTVDSRPHYFMMPDSPAESGSSGEDPSASDKEPVEDSETVKVETPTVEPSDVGKDNPYNWSFDLCQVTLANFRYRKMSLVRDYKQLLTELPRSDVFDSIFSLAPRPVPDEKTKPVDLSDRFDVVPCDPTQSLSISSSRDGSSYIIQGPPGTGKSQTITNLIADYVARGNRVLFVCEKRAAIDVVFARLRQCGLGDLCCLIHDSQADKKEFVMDLRGTYESFLKRDSGEEQAETLREQSLTGIRSAMDPLDAYANLTRDLSPHAGISVGELVDRAVAFREQVPELDEYQRERLPNWHSWNESRTAIESIVATVSRQQPDGILARHPLRHLSVSLVNDPMPLNTVRGCLERCKELIEPLEKALNNASFAGVSGEMTWSKLTDLLDYCQAIQPLTDSRAQGLLDPNSDMSKQLEPVYRTLMEKQRTLEEQREINSAWKHRISPRDLPTALATARRLAQKMIPVIYPSWWQLRRVMNRSYDFRVHPVRPDRVSVLTNLEAEYLAAEDVEDTRRKIEKQFGWKQPCEDILDLTDKLTRQESDLPDWMRDVHRKISQSPNQDLGPVVDNLLDQRPVARELRQQLDEFLTGYETQSFDKLRAELQNIDDSMDQLVDYLGCLNQLATVPEPVREALQRMDLTAAQIEAATIDRTVELTSRDHPEWDQFDQNTRRGCLDSLGRAHANWMSANAKCVRRRVRHEFLKKNHRAGVSDAGDRSEQEFRKSWNAGRKALEHEFGKQMRYKSIRDLVSGDSGEVVRALKPVWLMSPLSVSDTIPLAANEFDVVIFDEASQITLESSVPALFRAKQTIVVGDRQQLPPTSFFASKSADEDQEITFEEEGRTITWELERSSLLNHATRNLPSTMLGWHYRSRDEALISFSNCAFYNGRLMTIPEEKILQPASAPLVAVSAESAAEHIVALSDRPISFHRMDHGAYSRRRNRAEAEYIAEMVRQLMNRGEKRTIGIIAFSESQQDEIEGAMDRLATSDSRFSGLLEAELEREDDGQFTGLLIKNLENIQGDERDIVILSICYGPDPEGRMLMNFGPINQSGGEKRLNVAFSRAKHHMAIVSTIGHEAITNRHNVGANCLRNYLCYAQAVSLGDKTTMSAVLQGLSPAGDLEYEKRPVSPVCRDIAQAMTGHGLQCDFDIGHSGFRCDIGVRREGDLQYRLGVLVDSGDWYDQNPDTLDRELSRPRLLHAFGWTTQHVLTRQWLDSPDEVIKGLVEACQESAISTDNVDG